ncbi:MAG: tRNA lysidine(34) synthetase TilS [Proteobacteria bacterium]|nr:tRNA lysidine(34) synthetase TilS [Pseudomonadota bacterium]
MSQEVVHALNRWFDVQGESPVIVAYSGGRDSHVLLHALVQIRQQRNIQLSAIHINHGLQKASSDWATHCQQICFEFQVPIKVVSLKLKIPAGSSLEEVARQARYQQFALLLKKQDTLFSAHHQDDQAETFLLQLLRGSGIKGLGAIAPIKPLGEGRLARPLLEISREQIASYALQNQLKWVEDPSNHELQFRRNYMRHQVLPLLKNMNPNIEACISRSAQHCQQAHSLLDTYLLKDTLNCLATSNNTLKVTALQAHCAQKQPFILRFWFNMNGVTLPSLRKCQDILKQMLTAKRDANPCVFFGDWQIRRYQGVIYVDLKDEQARFKQIQYWDLNPIQLKDGHIWQARLVKGAGIQKAKFLTQKLAISYRQGGERYKQNGQTKSLKKLLQTYQIPPWQRQSIPLFYQGDELLAVGSILICQEQVTLAEEQGWVIEKTSVS